MSDSTIPEADAAEAKRRAEWLHKHKAHKDWIILSVSEVTVIRNELLKLERERDEAREEAKNLRGMSVIELMGENLNVNHHVTEWENRCLRAEKERDEARDESLEQARLLGISGEWGCRLIAERDEARKALKHIEEYGTEEINAAVDLRQKLASALVERDEAREELKKLQESISQKCG